MTEPKQLRPRRPRASPEPTPDAPAETVAEVVTEVMAEVVSAVMAGAPAAPEPEPYRTGRWHGHENHTCARCDFATLSRALIEDHVRTAHAAARR